jgi:hypothetical protein
VRARLAMRVRCEKCELVLTRAVRVVVSALLIDRMSALTAVVFLRARSLRISMTRNLLAGAPLRSVCK